MSHFVELSLSAIDNAIKILSKFKILETEDVAWGNEKYLKYSLYYFMYKGYVVKPSAAYVVQP